MCWAFFCLRFDLKYTRIAWEIWQLAQPSKRADGCHLISENTYSTNSFAMSLISWTDLVLKNRSLISLLTFGRIIVDALEDTLTTLDKKHQHFANWLPAGTRLPVARIMAASKTYTKQGRLSASRPRRVRWWCHTQMWDSLLRVGERDNHVGRGRIAAITSTTTAVPLWHLRLLKGRGLKKCKNPTKNLNSHLACGLSRGKRMSHAFVVSKKFTLHVTSACSEKGAVESICK